MSKGSGKAQQTTTQSSEPWKGLQPYLTDYLQKGQQATQNPYQFYNGTTTAGFSPEQQAGMNLNTQRALSGSPTLNAANRNQTNTLNGNYLSPENNPYLKQNVNTALNDVQTRVNSQFNGNNYGSSANQELLTRNLGDTANQMYGQNYANERGMQQQSAAMAPNLANADYNDGNQLQAIGAQRQGLSQQYLNNAANQFNGAANEPYAQLDRYGKVINGGSGQGGTQTGSSPNPNQSNPFANALGGASTGFSIGSKIGSVGGPLGALGGGALGLIFSDARLKSDIVKVGTHPLGVGVYDYTKFGKRERGVMAQEVEQVKPDAVSTHESGYKQVNYGLLN